MKYLQMSNECTHILSALHKIQNDLISIQKTAKGYNNDYTPYDSLIEKIKPLLTENNLILMQPVTALEDGSPAIATMLMHVAGEYIKSFTPIKDMNSKSLNEAQEYGGGITFTKRYALSAFFAWATGDQDIDSIQIKKTDREKERITKMITDMLQENNINGELKDTIIRDLDILNTTEVRSRVYKYILNTTLSLVKTYSEDDALKAWNKKVNEGLLK